MQRFAVNDSLNIPDQAVADSETLYIYIFKFLL